MGRDTGFPLLDRVDRYIVRIFVSSYLVAFLFFFGAFVVIDLFSNIDDFIDTGRAHNLEGSDIFRRVCGYYLYGSPAVFLQVAPFVTVIGVIVTVARLQQANELIPILMSGRSVYRTLRPIFVCGGVLTILMILMQELVAPHVAARRISIGEFLKDGHQHVAVESSLVDEQGNLWRGIKYDVKRDKIIEATVERREEGRVLLARKVRDLVYDHSSNPPGWRATGPGFHWLEIGYEAGAEKRQETEARFIVSSLEPRQIDAYMMEAFDLSFRDLGFLVATTPMERHRPRYIVLLHYHITFPLTNVLLILLALPFVVRYEKKGLMVGLALAFVSCALYFGSDFALRSLGENHLHPVLAAWFTPIFFGALGISLFDGIRT